MVGIDVTNILDTGSSTRDKIGQEEDEKINTVRILLLQLSIYM